VVRYITENEDETIHEPAPGAYLTLLVKNRGSQTFPIRGTVYLGRDKTNSIVVADQKVSRHHAVLSPAGEAFVLTDQGSANGTYLNGVLISQPTRLKSHDKVTIGDTTFLFSFAPVDPDQSDPDIAQPPNVSAPDPGTSPDSGLLNLPLANQVQPLWLILGCMGLVIIVLLIILALLFGLFIGRGQSATFFQVAQLFDLLRV
jgi:hypothetical protein